MARTAIVPVAAGSAGQDLSTGTTAIANGSGNGITLPTGKYVLWVSNPTGGSINITFKSNSADADGLTIPDKSVAIGAGKDFVFGPLPNSPYRQADDTFYIESSATGLVAIAFQATG